MSEITRILNAIEAAPDETMALATLVRIEGSSYRRPGARMLLRSDGRRIGSISGGCLEEDVALKAQEVLASGRPQVAIYDTTEENKMAWGVGLGCEGIVEVFIEPILRERPQWASALRRNQFAREDTLLVVEYRGDVPRGTGLADGKLIEPAAFREVVSAPPRLIVCGAGDDALPLVRMARELGWQITVADARPAYVTPERFPEAHQLVTGLLEKVACSLLPDDLTFAVVMTHRYVDDLVYLQSLIPCGLPYLGQLGPRKRTERLLRDLKTNGLEIHPALMEKLYAPVGLDLGGNTAETVALAVLAEMQACFAGRSAGFLRDRLGAIHD